VYRHVFYFSRKIIVGIVRQEAEFFNISTPIEAYLSLLLQIGVYFLGR